MSLKLNNQEKIASLSHSMEIGAPFVPATNSKRGWRLHTASAPLMLFHTSILGYQGLKLLFSVNLIYDYCIYIILFLYLLFPVPPVSFPLLLAFMASYSLIIIVSYLCIYNFYKHNQQKSFGVAPLCLGLASWDWVAHQRAHSRKRLIAPFSAIFNCPWLFFGK